MGIKAVIDMYENSVKKNNKKGFADTFKKGMKIFEKLIKRDLEVVTFENVKYLDGYFIFGMGDNSVVHFNLKETPGWKYGIWWNIPKKYYDKESKKYILPDYIEGTFFAQYEQNIDKFKPSASSICEKFTIVPNDKFHGYCLYNISEQINYIIKEPYLAFCRDLGYDYNTRYLSRRKAKSIYVKWFKDKKNYNRYDRYYTNKFLNFVKKMCSEEINNDELCIIDRGETWSPRYEIIVKQSVYPDLEEGCYDLFDESDPESLKLSEKWDLYFSKCEKQAEKHKVYLSRPLDKSFLLIADKNWKKLSTK